MKTRLLADAIARGIAVATLFGTCLHAPGLAITNVARNAAGELTFNVSATAGSTNTIEASQTLQFWFPLGSGVASNGLFPFVHAGSTNFGRMFYRARSGPEAPADSVTYGVNTNYKAYAVITPETGGRCQIIMSNGLTYTFSARSNLVSQPVLISMTLVTNIVHELFATDRPLAVLFEPSGLLFAGLAELEILYPTNVPPGFNLGLSFGSDGSEFHLVPSLVYSNRVVIPIGHFSGYSITPPLTPASAVARLMTRSLNNASAQLENQLSARRAASIQGGPGLSANFRSDMQSLLRDYFERVIKPALEASGGDCGVAEVALRDAYWLSEQWYLDWGDPGDRSIHEFTRQKACEALANCENELDTLSCTNFPYAELVRRAFGYANDRMMFGCSESAASPTDRWTNCAPDWYGTITVRQEGSTNYTEYTINRVGSFLFSWSAFVTEAQAQEDGNNNVSIIAYLKMEASKAAHGSISHSTAPNCPRSAGHTDIDEVKQTATGQPKPILLLTVYDGVPFACGLAPDPNAPELFTITQVGQEVSSTLIHPCDGGNGLKVVYPPEIIESQIAVPYHVNPTDLIYTTNRIYGTSFQTNLESAGNVFVTTVTQTTIDLRRKQQ